MKKKCLFIGSKELGFTIFKSLVEKYPSTILGCVTYDDRDDVRSKFNEFNEYCEEKDIHLEILDKPSKLKSIIENIKPDFCLVIGWYWIIGKETLKLCKSGFIGIHASLLPKYRGCSPLVWAMINGEKETGVSMFYFDEGIDSGEIIAQKSISILEQDYISDLLIKVENETKKIIDEEYPKIVNGTNEKMIQNNEDISYCAQRMPEHGRINWNSSSIDIYNFIRAQSKPYPGAYTVTNEGRIVKIFKSEIFKYMYYGLPGQIVSVQDNKVLVVCKNGAVLLSIDKNDIDDNLKDIFKYGDILK